MKDLLPWQSNCRPVAKPDSGWRMQVASKSGGGNFQDTKGSGDKGRSERDVWQSKSFPDNRESSNYPGFPVGFLWLRSAHGGTRELCTWIRERSGPKGPSWWKDREPVQATVAWSLTSFISRAGLSASGAFSSVFPLRIQNGWGWGDTKARGSREGRD